MKLLVFFVLITWEIVAGSNLDEGSSCIIQYLKNKNTIEEDFPTPSPIDSAKCRVVMPLLLKNVDSALRIQLSEKLGIDVECTMRNFKNTSAMDYMLIREIIQMSRDLENSEITQKVRNSTKVLRKILVSVAKKCNFDKSYGGLFDDVLGIQNLTIPVLEHNYCFTKYAIDNKLIEVKHVNVNPRRIPTANVDCEEMLEKNQIMREKKLQEKLNRRNLSDENVQCMMDNYRREKAFASNVALEVIDILNISYEEKRSNREQIAKQLERFITSIFTCVRGSHPNEIMQILQLVEMN